MTEDSHRYIPVKRPSVSMIQTGPSSGREGVNESLVPETWRCLKKNAKCEAKKGAVFSVPASCVEFC